MRDVITAIDQLDLSELHQIMNKEKLVSVKLIHFISALLKLFNILDSSVVKRTGGDYLEILIGGFLLFKRQENLPPGFEEKLKALCCIYRNSNFHLGVHGYHLTVLTAAFDFIMNELPSVNIEESEKVHRQYRVRYLTALAMQNVHRDCTSEIRPIHKLQKSQFATFQYATELMDLATEKVRKDSSPIYLSKKIAAQDLIHSIKNQINEFYLEYLFQGKSKENSLAHELIQLTNQTILARPELKISRDWHYLRMVGVFCVNILLLVPFGIPAMIKYFNADQRYRGFKSGFFSLKTSTEQGIENFNALLGKKVF